MAKKHKPVSEVAGRCAESLEGIIGTLKRITPANATHHSLNVQLVVSCVAEKLRELEKRTRRSKP